MLVILVILALIIAYYFLKLNYQYWEKRGIPGPKPNFLVGNMGRSFILKASPGEIFAEAYHKYNDSEIVGMYRATTPVLVVRDPDLVKEVTIKSFDHFSENDYEVDKRHDPIFARNPFVLKGEEWRLVRAQLTPGFTSGKMKWLYPYLENISRNLVKFIEDTNTKTCCDVKEICRRFTLNNVATCAFGLEGKCLEEENSEFRQLAKDFFTPPSSFFLMTVSPTLSKTLATGFIKKNILGKFVDMVTQTLKYREDNNIVRNDYLHVVSQLKKDTSKFTDIDVTAHAAGFFGEGYETSSILMSFVLFEIASNPSVQKKLRDEINAVFEENGRKLPYEALQGMSYLDGVVNETLRVHPPMFSLQKICTKTFTYTPKNSKKPVVIETGTPIILPVYGLHHDPKYYEDPETFKPERFIGGNKEKLTKYTFLPFGEGPRICLGKRFGVLQIKVGIAYIIQNFEISVNEKTIVPVKYDPINIMTAPVGGLWLDFKRITA